MQGAALSNILKVLIAIPALVLPLAGSAWADDDNWHRESSFLRCGEAVSGARIDSRCELPTKTDGGTYSRDMSVQSDPGNGTYVQSRQNRSSGRDGNVDNGNPDIPGPPVRIIHVNPATDGRSCPPESGVCIISR